MKKRTRLAVNARARAVECRTIAEQFATNEMARESWEAMADDYEALADIYDKNSELFSLEQGADARLRTRRREH